MELAAYELLSRIAQRANDQQTVELAKQIAAQESEMARRLSDNWDVAVDASLRDKDPDDLGEQLNKYLSDAHAIESQAEQMLTKAIDIGGDPKLSQDYEEHLEQTRHHKSLIEERLEARGASSNFLKDAAMKLGALNWGTFFAAQPDTPAKLAGFAYAFEHLEIASYEQLRRVAERAGDESVAGVAQTILPEERHAAETLWDGLRPGDRRIARERGRHLLAVEGGRKSSSEPDSAHPLDGGRFTPVDEVEHGLLDRPLYLRPVGRVLGQTVEYAADR